MNFEGLKPLNIGYLVVSENKEARRSAGTNPLAAALSSLRTRAYLTGTQGEG
jgi:hypothetical protein